MRAILLVGGEGTRLRPLTWRTPKALVPILGRPLLEHLLLHLKRHGVDRVTLAMTSRSEAVREAFEDGAALGIALEYAYEDTPLGSGGAIGAITPTWRNADGGPWDETFLVVNGDVVTDLDVSAMLEHHRAHNALLTLALHEVADPSPFGVVDLDEDGCIRRFVEKPRPEDAPSHLINAGTWIFEPQLIDRLDPTSFHRVENKLFPDLCSAGESVYGFHRDAYWADVGTPEALLRVNLDLASGRAPLLAEPPADGLWVASTATVEEGATLEAPAVIGAGCIVRSGATVGRSLLWDGVTIGAGASVRDSVLAAGATVEGGASVTRSVVAHEARVSAHTALLDERIEPADRAAVVQA